MTEREIWTATAMKPNALHKRWPFAVYRNKVLAYEGTACDDNNLMVAIDQISAKHGGVEIGVAIIDEPHD